MKKIIFYMLFTITAVGLSAGCSSKDDNGGDDGGGEKEKTQDEILAENIQDEWHLTQWSSDAPEQFDVYVAFKDGTFTIYQLVETLDYLRYTGTWRIENEIFGGLYTDGTSFGDSYAIAFNESLTTFTLTSQKDATDVSVYTKEAIPAEVKDEATDAETTRANFRRLF